MTIEKQIVDFERGMEIIANNYCYFVAHAVLVCAAFGFAKGLLHDPNERGYVCDGNAVDNTCKSVRVEALQEFNGKMIPLCGLPGPRDCRHVVLQKVQDNKLCAWDPDNCRNVALQETQDMMMLSAGVLSAVTALLLVCYCVGMIRWPHIRPTVTSRFADAGAPASTESPRPGL